MRRSAPRPGFTLVELLVVMGIVVILAGLSLLIGNTLARQQQASRGAEQVQGSIYIAKQTALRDRTLYGIRLLQDADGNFRELQYIHQPPDYVRNRATVDKNNLVRVRFEKDISDGLGADTTLWPVQVGDFIQMRGEATPHRIVKIISTLEVETQSANTGPTDFFTTDFRILRAARPVPGEEIIALPPDVIIDAALSEIVAENGKYDIMFAPAGNVVGNASRAGKIVLRVRDVTQRIEAPEQTYIVVYTRTGSVASYAVDVESGDPQSAIKNDTRPNGL